ncbi:unnamed protein product [Adineta steineri]|uniref:G domain-containing protein n=1 Tax=Adineta steineri TaxID=433720 RepID=A0A813VQ40_9BILA|nr:unnamed protein product [Adineta steineri]CAF1124744.1 unnamed protein product [Adineta steineri]
MTSDSDLIERKAIDVGGRLGSLYDVSTDNLINAYSIQSSKTQSLKLSECAVFAGDESLDMIDYLKKMDFDNALQLSILFGMVKTSGVSSLITCKQTIDKNTRFLYYSYKSKEEILNIERGKLHRLISTPSVSTNATHMITHIIWGFEILCVIPIPEHLSSDTVDRLLSNISKWLKNDAQDSTLTNRDKQHIEELININIYGSETCIGNDVKMPFSTILTTIQQWQKHENFHHPLKYRMHSLRYLYNSKDFPELSYRFDEINNDIKKMSSIFIYLDSFEKYYEQSLENLPEKFLNPTLEEALKDIQQHLHLWSSTYKKLREKFQELLKNIRRGHNHSVVIANVLSDKEYVSLSKDEIEKFNAELQQLTKKAALIKQSNDDDIQYINILDLRYHNKVSTNLKDIEKILRRHFLNKNNDVIFFYSNDRLKDIDPKLWKQIYQQFISKRQQATQKTISVYVDFTECQYDLEDFITITIPMDSSSQAPHNNSSDIDKSISPPSTPEINVLLLGETGVGKSTFINAFVNYLIFDTLEQAEQSEPIVLIPVSFVTTVGDQFDEVTIKFGDIDANENYEQQGQSVTQQCKSYLFQLNDKIHLRFIDTPGMGDTRGIEQDDKNIDHILTYVNSLSHLNAICLLLKPNTSRLNIFFRSCIHQLLTYLTPIGYNNIIFCFTNARSTFFAPGNTSSLLRKMLKQENVNDVPFQKQNTFCFDSESFRYLAARKCAVTFDEFQTQECIKSWSASVVESKRLLTFIQTRELYLLHRWQSPRKCALEILMIARPLMETLHLILYNWKLREAAIVTEQMVLKSKADTNEKCTNCAKSRVVQVGLFRIVYYEPLNDGTNERCLCLVGRKHFLIEYTVQYVSVAEKIKDSTDDLKNRFYDLLYSCDRLSHFLQQKGLSNFIDPFACILERFLEEERQILNAGHRKSNLNKEVNKMLREIPLIRQKNNKKLIDSNEQLPLNQIDQLIHELESMPDVRQQIECIKTSRQSKMKTHESIVKISSLKNKLLTEFTNTAL